MHGGIVNCGILMTETEEGHVTEFGGEEQASEAVLRAIAVVSNRPLLELPPLQESIDVDSLNQLFDAPATSVSLQFEYDEYEVRIEPGRVRVSERH